MWNVWNTLLLEHDSYFPLVWEDSLIRIIKLSSETMLIQYVRCPLKIVMLKLLAPWTRRVVQRQSVSQIVFCGLAPPSPGSPYRDWALEPGTAPDGRIKHTIHCSGPWAPYRSATTHPPPHFQTHEEPHRLDDACQGFSVPFWSHLPLDILFQIISYYIFFSIRLSSAPESECPFN